MKCRFCDKKNLRFRNEPLSVGLHGALVLTMRSKHTDTGWSGEDVVLSAYSSALCGYCDYRPKYCPECGRKLQDDAGETA